MNNRFFYVFVVADHGMVDRHGLRVFEGIGLRDDEASGCKAEEPFFFAATAEDSLFFCEGCSYRVPLDGTAFFEMPQGEAAPYPLAGEPEKIDRLPSERAMKKAQMEAALLCRILSGDFAGQDALLEKIRDLAEELKRGQPVTTGNDLPPPLHVAANNGGKQRGGRPHRPPRKIGAPTRGHTPRR